MRRTHPLRVVLGELATERLVSRLTLAPLSQAGVADLARRPLAEVAALYELTRGNPFFVSEVLAGADDAVPDTVRDAVLARRARMSTEAQRLLDAVAVLPGRAELALLEAIAGPAYAELEDCLASGMLVDDGDGVRFRHEIARVSVEDSLPPGIRAELHGHALRAMVADDIEVDPARLAHHADRAGDVEAVLRYAPVAGERAAALRAHRQAAEQYALALAHADRLADDAHAALLERYAYECYLTDRTDEAFSARHRALALHQAAGDQRRVGDTHRWLSRLAWFRADRATAVAEAEAAVRILDALPAGRELAMAYSNMSQLKMLGHEEGESLEWSERARRLAEELGETEILVHSLNNAGTALAQAGKDEGTALLEHSLQLALDHGLEEHVARAYTNIGHNWIVIKEYGLAKNALEAGIRYCEERDLDSWTIYMLADKAKLLLETGNWSEAQRIADNLLKDENLSSIVKMGALTVLATIKMRKGEMDVLPLLKEAKEKAFAAMELQRIIPALVACLEYEWITGNKFIEQESLNTAMNMAKQMGNIYENSEFAFWINKAGRPQLSLSTTYEGYDTSSIAKALKAAASWQKSVCLYEQALVLFEGTEADKKKALAIVHGLGAEAVYEKMKFEMRGAGIKSIPRRARKTSTQSNPSFLTDRELEILQLLQQSLPNKEIASRLFISAKTVDHHISAILFKLDVNSRTKAVHEAEKLGILK